MSVSFNDKAAAVIKLYLSSVCYLPNQVALSYIGTPVAVSYLNIKVLLSYLDTQVAV